MFAPSDESVQAVKNWLTTSGINDTRITLSKNKGWLAFIASSEEAESLLHTNFYEYRDSETNDTAIVSERYHVPRDIQEHIDYITPGIRFPFFRKREEKNPFRSSLRIPAPDSITKSLALNLTNCDTAVTPDCIAALYQIPRPLGTPSPNNSLGIFEEGDTYYQLDLDSYFTTYPSCGIPNGTAPIMKSVDGGTAPGSSDVGESNLDFSLAYPIIYPQTITLYQTDDNYYSEGGARGFLNTFLDAIDGVCTPFLAPKIFG